ncbi:MAG: hypothetical protein DRI34_06760 [Deltaproteobacteria bacterium]|nr:MAG: hypothetical protein DRI34_06760 [Deltaproteobacteria bacterium]
MVAVFWQDDRVEMAGRVDMPGTSSRTGRRAGGWLLLLLLAGCSGGRSSPCPQTGEYQWRGLLAGPGEDDFDGELARVARQRDRQFWALHALPLGLNAELAIDRGKAEVRQAVERFLREQEGWDFTAASGLDPVTVVDSWWSAVGAYAGAGIAADAFRYGVLRDQCYPAEEVERARAQLLRALDGLHLALEVTGTPGVIARGLLRRDYPGGGDVTTVELFDEQGNPLPAEKDNGTWRADQSGRHPEIVWVDSCSRDMLIGWVLGFGAAWEVIAADADIADAVRQRLRADARALADNLRTVRPNGYDLELLDADGRTTYHGYLNENNLDRLYIDGSRNGFHAIMALGIMAALAYIVDDAGLDDYLYDELIHRRRLAVIARENSIVLNLDNVTNFSNYNMAFAGAWLALRHLRREESARDDVLQALEVQLFDTPGKEFQPAQFGNAFYDLVTVAGRCRAAAGQACTQVPDEALLARMRQTLQEFPRPPFWEFARENCDAQEIAAGSCLAEDGQTVLTVLGEVGRGGALLVAEPLPMRLRPPSNYYWRSSPYQPNGGSDGPNLYPGPDFRLAYWAARWIRRVEP